ncbi:MAG: mechanosensitive ion channel family protein [Synechococcales cyanobacterium T60_A2020_003]|nr:mechanosensitive ion channel family protein [Synechococcales cyanobacterium T60_A2020_003]
MTAPISPDKPEVGQSNLRIWVGSIESSLYRVVSRNIDPDHLYVAVASLDKQTVILAGTQNQSTQEILLTVTELDAQLAQQSIPVLAQNWTNIIHKALQQAWEARSPAARRQQMLQAVGLLASIFAISLGLSAIRRWLYRLFKWRKQHIHDLPSSEPPDPNTYPEDSAAELVRDFQHSLAQKQRQRLNIWLRRILRLLQLAVWSSGVCLLMLIFPESRPLGYEWLGFNLKLVIIVLSMVLLVLLGRFLMNVRLTQWVEEASLEPAEIQRVTLRAPTLAGVFEGIITVTAWIIGIVLLIDWQQIPIKSLLSSVGLLGVAFGLVFQSLLRDGINGLFIIFGDQYAVGDTVTIAGINGQVERMSLRSTSIRGAGGSLNTVPHGQITTVQNLTKDWSRVEMTIQITKDSDATQAMRIMHQVADEMAQDPDWQTRILELISRLG